MRKFFVLLVSTLLLFAACCPQSTHAQQVQGQKIVVNTTDLTPDQLAKIQAEKEIAELQAKVDTYGKWVGIGGEIGQAVRDGLNAVVDVSDKFSKTDVGHFTIMMIAWKVVGRDIVRFVLGFIFMIISVWFVIFSFKTTCIDRKICTKNPGLFKGPKEYTIVKPKFDDGNGLGAIRFLHIIAIFGAIGISFAIMVA